MKANDSTSSKPSRLLRLPEVMNRVGLSRSSIYRRQDEGSFPASISLGGRATGWLENDIDQWVNERVSHAAHEHRKTQKLKDFKNA